jgi:hypothetical protein
MRSATASTTAAMPSRAGVRNTALTPCASSAPASARCAAIAIADSFSAAARTS